MTVLMSPSLNNKLPFQTPIFVHVKSKHASIEWGNPTVVRRVRINKGNGCDPFVLAVEISLKTLSVHILNCETLKMGCRTKPMTKI